MSVLSPEQACKEFLQHRQSLVLSTKNQQGVLETSVAPFVCLDNRFYIYVSDLATHTQNLRQASAEASVDKDNTDQQGEASVKPYKPWVSVLFLADEANTAQLFARERLQMHCSVQQVFHQQNTYAALMTEFTATFGDIMPLLNTLDFHLFVLTPVRGSYVRGFGEAYEFKAWPCQSMQQKGR